MWNWFNCYLSGRHDYGKWCESGTIFLRCVHCGRRSPGWAIDGRQRSARTDATPAKATTLRPAPSAARIVPFNRGIAS
jgi:hypothetical protein